MNSEIMLKKTKLEFIKIDLNENLKNNEENKNKECNKKKNNLLDIFKSIFIFNSKNK